MFEINSLNESNLKPISVKGKSSLILDHNKLLRVKGIY